MAAELAVTQATFQQDVLESELPVLVDFWATWCPPCLRIAPVVEEMAQTFAGQGKVRKVDVDSNGALAQQYNIMSIPALIIFKNGQEVDRMVGAGSKQELESFFKKHIG
jgi:thioredoxin 1